MTRPNKPRDEATTDAEAPAAAPAPAPAPVAKSDWPKFLKSTTSFGYTDPVTNIHYSPVAAVRVDAAPSVGSWLAIQMAAKLIGEA
jgi:hypothetical protein